MPNNDIISPSNKTVYIYIYIYIYIILCKAQELHYITYSHWSKDSRRCVLCHLESVRSLAKDGQIVIFIYNHNVNRRRTAEALTRPGLPGNNLRMNKHCEVRER